jgi:hypothetical protein
MATSGSGPFVGAPVAASEPARGALTLAFIEDTNVPGGVNGWATVTTAGRVDQGPIDGRETRRIGIAGESAVGATGGYRAISTVETDDSGTGHAARAATGKAYFGFPLGATLTTAALANPAIDAGGNNSGFALFEAPYPTPRVEAWTAGLDGAFVGPVTLAEGTTTPPGVAADGDGEALAAAGGGTGVLYADYRSASAEEASRQPTTIVVRRARSTRDGKVRLLIIAPKAGVAVFLGSASVTKTVALPGPGTRTILLAPNRKARRVVKKRGKLGAKLSIAFSAPGDPVGTASRRILFRAPKGRPKRR